MPGKSKRKPKPPALFGRAILPASRPQTTKKGARGYRRTEAKREEREGLGESPRPPRPK